MAASARSMAARTLAAIHPTMMPWHRGWLPRRTSSRRKVARIATIDEGSSSLPFTRISQHRHDLFLRDAFRAQLLYNRLDLSDLLVCHVLLVD